MSIELKSTYASLPRTTRGTPLVISGDPKDENFLYCNGNAVIIRNLENPADSDIYTEHSCQTTVACYSPSRFYIASADISGKVRIWDTVNKEHILWKEYQPIAGPIKDIGWDGESKRIMLGGEGRESFGKIITADSGNTLGEIMGQSKAINAVGFRLQRPYRIATASEDCSIAFYHGPPFKFQCTIGDHTNFVNALRYSKNGEYFVSGGADRRVFLYDGKTGEKKRQLGDPAHSGGIYAVSFSPDSTKVLTVSGDKTAKTWDVESGEMLQEFKLGSKVEDMQVGCLWQGDTLVTVSLSGFINYLDPANPEKPKRIIKGHNKPITSLAISRKDGVLFTAASDGNICHWDAVTGESDLIQGKGHSNQVQSLCLVEADNILYSCGVDDLLISSDTTLNTYGTSTKLPSQPKAVDAKEGGLAIVACYQHVVILRNGRIVFIKDVPYEPSSVNIHPGLTEVAVGAITDNSVHIYTLNSDTLEDCKALEQTGNISCLQYSPDGEYLAAADGNRKIVLYQLPNYEAKITSEWCFHSAKVTCMEWRQDSRYLATGGLDSAIMVLNPDDKYSYTAFKRAHPISHATQIKWLDDNTIVTTGQDSHVKIWTYKPGQVGQIKAGIKA